MNIKETLDLHLEQLNPQVFIENDPIQFPHRFTDIRDIEISAFVTSCLAFGNRKQIIKKCEELHKIMGDSPYDFVTSKKWEIWKLNQDKFYRFYSYNDIYDVFERLNTIYRKYGSLGQEMDSRCVFKPNHLQSLQYLFIDCKMVSKSPNSACKRLNMFLRWMVRKDSIDLGVWDFIDTKDLLIPLDVHVGRVARSLGLLTHKQDDMKAVVELTDNLKKFDANDPVKYDLVLFSLGINSK